MTSMYQEFTEIYKEFQKRFPTHQLNDELKNRIRQKRFPTDEWLQARIKCMKDLLSPIWLRSGLTKNRNKNSLEQ